MWDEEENYFNDRKVWKKERKKKSQTDRSKYKVTDRTKKEVGDNELKDLLGRVISIGSKGIIVTFEDQIWTCQLKGKLKQEIDEHKNIVAVGDWVDFTPLDPVEGVIHKIMPRTSELVRQDNLTRKKKQLIAANVDQVGIVVSCISPPLKSTLIDRYIIAALKGGLKPIIIVNKIDLLDSPDVPETVRQEQRTHVEECQKAYEQAGITFLTISAKDLIGFDKLKETLKDKTSVFSGQSGVGKTSLINEVTGLDLKIGGVVSRTQKGSHTTSNAQLIPLPFGGYCVDTPGIKSFGVWELAKDEIEPFFTEIHALKRKCHFPNCSHTHEEGCAVKKAVEKGKLTLIRYLSYLNLFGELSTDYLRR